MTRGDGQIVVTWVPPEDNGGAPITGYRVRYRSETADEDSGSGRSRRDVVDPNTLWNFRPWQETGASGNRDEIAAALDEEATYLVEVQARNAGGDRHQQVRSMVHPATHQPAPDVPAFSVPD